MLTLFLIANVCILLLVTVKANEKASGCPSPPASYAPCDCTEFPDDSQYLTLDCSYKHLGDSRVSKILDAFVNGSAPGGNRLTRLYLAENQLTRVPKQIKFLTQLRRLFISHNNIASVETGVFNFTSSLRFFDLYNNNVSSLTIAPGAFKSKTS